MDAKTQARQSRKKERGTEKYAKIPRWRVGLVRIIPKFQFTGHNLERHGLVQIEESVRHREPGGRFDGIDVFVLQPGQKVLQTLLGGLGIGFELLFFRFIKSLQNRHFLGAGGSREA